jgi:hypothetical protein
MNTGTAVSLALGVLVLFLGYVWLVVIPKLKKEKPCEKHDTTGKN